VPTLQTELDQLQDLYGDLRKVVATLETPERVPVMEEPELETRAVEADTAEIA
jgi:hypothetical protein